jgi:hypothetical protein
VAFGGNEKHEVVVQEHTTIYERIAAAQELVERFAPGLDELVVDSMDNDTDNRYEAQSSRNYVMHEKKIVCQRKVGPSQISPTPLQAFLCEWPVLKTNNNKNKEP